jgi:hypothetical protein
MERRSIILQYGASEMSIDFATGIERNTVREDYCTKISGCAIAPKGTPCPIWLSFLVKVMGDNQELVDYLQRVCGYCLTGLITEHAMFFLYGTGANGKSVFINTVRGIMGTYHTTAPTGEDMSAEFRRREAEHPARTVVFVYLDALFRLTRPKRGALETRRDRERDRAWLRLSAWRSQ